jgi:hypothetical protein
MLLYNFLYLSFKLEGSMESYANLITTSTIIS